MQATAQYMSAKDAAESWGISQRRVAILCSEGRIANAALLGNMWIIPKQAEKPIDARHLRKKIEPAKPFIKWAGGKGQLLGDIKKRLPKEIGQTIVKYAEPFVGGGAFLFEILQNYNIKSAYISDKNHALIAAYKQIKDDVESLITMLSILKEEFYSLVQEDRKQYYYNKRKEFNKILTGTESKQLELATLMIFINKTCFNGLYRVNSKGEYNVPMGDYKNPLICDAENLRAVSKLLKNVEIVYGGYESVEKFADENTLIYFDPPYRPLNISSSFTAYIENGFNDEEQVRLANFARKLTSKNVKVMLSNSDPKNTNIEDTFFDDLYEGLNIKRVQANRMINSSAYKRGKITELLITNY